MQYAILQSSEVDRLPEQELRGILEGARNYLLCSCEGDVDMVADVLATEEFDEAVLHEDCLHLGIDAREYYLDVLLLTHKAEVLEVVQACRVDERHLTHAYDAHLGIVAEALHHLLGAVACPEEVRAIDFVYLHALRNGEVLEVARLHVGVFADVYLVVDDAHVGGLTHAAHEEEAGAYESHLDGYGEVEDYGEEEREQQYCDVALRVLEHCEERAPSAHAIGNDYQDACEACHRDETCQGHEEEEDEQQHGSMNDSGYRRAPSVVDIGHRARYGSRCWYSAEERRGEVGDALSDEFGIRVMMVACNAVGNSCREQALYGSENGDGEGWCCQSLYGVPRHLWHLRLWNLGVDAEAVAYGLDGIDATELFEQQGHYGDNDYRDERAWDFLAYPRHEGYDDDAQQSHCRAPQVDVADVLEVGNPFLDEVGGVAAHLHSREVLYLRGEDGYGDTAGESHDDGVGNVLYNCPEPEHSHEDEEHASHERGDGESLNAILGDDA